MVQTWWQKLNANERMAATGAIIVFVMALLGTSWLSLIGSGVVLAVYWLKYSPNQISWPAPVELINVVISGLIGLFAVVGLLFVLGLGSFGFGMLGVGGGGFLGGVYLLAVAAAIAFAVGAAMMVLGTWREYQAAPKTAPPTTPSAPPPPPATTPSTPPAAPTSAPPAAPPSAPPAAPPSEPPSA